MSELIIHPEIQNHIAFKYLKKKFDSGYLRQIDKFLAIPYKGRHLLVNTFFIKNRIDDDDATALPILNLFSEPLPFFLFLKKLSDAFHLNLSSPTPDGMKLIVALLEVTRMLFEEKFIVYESFNEYAQLARFREDIMTYRFVGVAYIMASLDCNFSCPGCFIYRGAPKKKIQMTPEVFDRELDFVLKNLLKTARTKMHFIFYGGEPLMNKPLVEYAANKILKLKKEGAFGRRNVSISMVTNGSLIDETAVNIFKKYKITPGVSLDGVEKSNDANRIFSDGTGTFKAILRGIRMLEKHDVPYGISCTIGPKNIDALPKDLEWMAKNLKARGIFFNIMEGISKDIFAEIGKENFYKKMHAIYDKMRELGFNEGRLGRYRLHKDKNRPPYVFYCAAVGGGQFILRPDGMVGICHAGMMFDEEQFEDPSRIGKIYENPVTLRWLPRTPLFMKDCYLKCNYFSLCPGGCPYRAEKVTGNMYIPCESECIKEKFLMERAIIEDYEDSIKPSKPIKKKKKR